MNSDFSTDFWTGSNHFYHVEAWMSHCGGGCHTSWFEHKFSINGYCHIQTQNLLEYDDGAEGAGWRLERVKTADNGHGSTCRLLRLTHVGHETAPYGSHFFVKVWTSDPSFRLPQGRGMKQTCEVDCVECDALVAATSEPDETCSTPHCPCGCVVAEYCN